MYKSYLISGLSLAALLLACSPIMAQRTTRGGQPTASPFAHESVEKAWELAVRKQKPLVVMFTTDGCLYCRKMQAETFANPSVSKFLKQHSETVLAHSRDHKSLVKKLGVRGYPTTLLVSPQGEVLDFVEGFVEPKEFAARFYPHITSSKTAAQIDAGSAVAVAPADH